MQEHSANLTPFGASPELISCHYYLLFEYRKVEYRLIFNFCLLISKVSSFKTLREVFVKLPILFYYGSKRHTNTEQTKSKTDENIAARLTLFVLL